MFFFFFLLDDYMFIHGTEGANNSRDDVSHSESSSAAESISLDLEVELQMTDDRATGLFGFPCASKT
jgi:hypothetical protein